MDERSLTRGGTVLTLSVAMVALAIASLAFLLSNSQPATAQSDPCFEPGDIFAAIGGGQVNWFRADGTFVKTLDTGQDGRWNAGMAFDAEGNLYVTNFNNNSVTKFDRCGERLRIIPTGGTWPESITPDCGGYFYVGHAGGDRDIRKYDPDWNLVGQFDAQTEARGTDWIDLDADQCTMFYTSEGQRIMRYDVCTDLQLTDFASLPGRRAFELRVLQDRGVLVADYLQAIYRLDATGTIVMTYTHPAETQWRNLSLDPDGTSLRGGAWESNIHRFDIATGEILTGTIEPGEGELRGVDVFCEPRAASCNCADLAVTKADSPDPVTVGDKFAYTIVVANNGPTPAMGVTLTDTLPSGVTFVSARDAECTEADGKVVCSLGKMISGEGVTIKIIVTPKVKGTITNRATVASTAYDPDLSNNVAVEDTRVKDEEGGPTIPEPTTLTLLGLGVAGLAGYIQRQRQAKKPTRV